MKILIIQSLEGIVKLMKVGRFLRPVHRPVPHNLVGEVGSLGEGGKLRLRTDGFPTPFRAGINFSHPYLEFINFAIISTSFFLAAFGCAADDPPILTLTITEHSGRLSVEANSKNGLELGKISPVEKKTGMICVKNRTPLEIKLGGWRSPCVCLDLDEPVWDLSPGAESKAKAVLDGSAYRGSFEKNMHISFSAKDLETVNFFLPVRFAVIGDEKPVDGNNSKTASNNENQDEKSLLVRQIEMEAKEFNPNDMESVFVFAGRTCPGCNYMRRVLGPKLLGKYGIHRGQVALLDLEKPENMLILANLEEKLGSRGTKTPVLYFNGMMMYGKAEVEAEIERNLSDKSVKKTTETNGNGRDAQRQGHRQDACATSIESKPIVLDMNRNGESLKSVRRKAEGITIGVIAMAGLIDGINPCVFAGLVFLASLLASSRMGGRKILVTGAAYCLGSFICYFLMGFLFTFLAVLMILL